MIEFEKLWEKNGSGICGKDGCERYWRMALEQILKVADDAPGPEHNSYWTMINWITSELGE